MSILVEDSPRNLARWIVEAVGRRLARGAVITPFATPKESITAHRGAGDVSTMVTDVGGEVWFDPTTHALQMNDVGDFRFYDDYDLWPGARGDLSTAAARQGHLERVFRIQDGLGATALAPTILLNYAETATSEQALQLAQEAIAQRPDCWLSIAGTSPFWSSGSALDAHIGALAQLEPTGWFITVTRHLSSLPVDAQVEEVHGLCRTVRSLSEYGNVHISHGDLAGLPAVAAGAHSLGSGWDQRQRVSAFSDYTPRTAGGSGGSWYQRPTFPGLFGSLKPAEAAQLTVRDRARADRLGPVPPPGPQEAYLHHLTVLNQLIDAVASGRDYETRQRILRRAYRAAEAEWPDVCSLSACDQSEADWIHPLRIGLERYAAGEGW